jgi:hypothetical protein
MNNNKFIYSFIPLHIPNRIVIYALDILKTVSTPFMKRDIIKKNKLHNIDEISKINCRLIPDRFIENQAQLDNLAFGNGKHTNMSYSGCEIIAVYNVLLSLNVDVSGDFIANLISYFEKKGSILCGEFGTSPKALYKYFKRNKYKALITYSTNTQKINAIGQTHDTFIATFYNDKFDINKMIHTVCITKNENGSFTAHNAYKKDKNGNYSNTPKTATITETIDSLGTNPKLISLIGIKTSFT